MKNYNFRIIYPFVYSCVIFTLLTYSIDTFGQRKSGIRNVSFELNDQKLITSYDLFTGDNEPRNIVFFLWDKDYNVLRPESLSGDFGAGVEPGNDKQIIWDIYEDNKLVKGKVRPGIFLEDQLRYGGASNAFLSVLIPGLGGYFVADYRNIAFKPYFRTASVIGLSTIGVIALQNYSREKLYSNRVNWNTGQPEITFNGYGESNYWLFPYDYAIFFGGAAIIWMYDIIWVAARGGHNQKLRKAFNDVSFQVTDQHASFSIRKKF
jgi:hypothetical protein